MEQLNHILKNVLTSRQRIRSEYYIDFLNIACLLNGVRNGVHLDTIHNKKLMNTLKTELNTFASFDSNTRWETTIWRKDILTQEEAFNSWAFAGDVSKMDTTDYWANNARLLGNSDGYPTFTKDPTRQGRWSLNLILNYDGESQYPMSMMGGVYDKTQKDDLRSIVRIREFLFSLLGQTLYNPSGHRVFLENVDLNIR